MMACAALCALLSKRQRRLALSVLAILIASTAFGLIARSANANLYLRYAVEEIGGEASSGNILAPSHAARRNPQASTPSCENLNTRNSVAIRKQLISDAVNLSARAGLFGFGFMSFGQLGCFEGVSPHNDFVQALLEFGWFGRAS